MKKLITTILIFFILTLPLSVFASPACEEFYYILNGKAVKSSINQPNSAYSLTIDPALAWAQPYLFRLRNGDMSAVYRLTEKTNNNHRKIFFKNLATGHQAIIQDVINRNDGYYWALTWPRAIQLSNGDIYVVFSTHNATTYLECEKNKPCLIDARIRVVKSIDNGATWTLISELTNDLTGDPNRGGLWQPSIIELNNHSLGMILTEQAIRPQGTAGKRTKADSVSYYTSSNGGRTWLRRSNIYTTFDTVANEGDIFQHSSGKLFAVFSTSLSDNTGVIQLSSSDDFGTTWSTPKTIANTTYKANGITPLIQKINSSYVLYYHKAPNAKEDSLRIPSIKIADNLSASAFVNAADHTPTVIGTGTVGSACQPPPSPAHNPADLTDEGDTPGDEVNIFDYNVLIAGFGTTYDIFDYNTLVGRFGE